MRPVFRADADLPGELVESVPRLVQQHALGPLLDIAGRGLVGLATLTEVDSEADDVRNGLAVPREGHAVDTGEHSNGF